MFASDPFFWCAILAVWLGATIVFVVETRRYVGRWVRKSILTKWVLAIVLFAVSCLLDKASEEVNGPYAPLVLFLGTILAYLGVVGVFVWDAIVGPRVLAFVFPYLVARVARRREGAREFVRETMPSFRKDEPSGDENREMNIGHE